MSVHIPWDLIVSVIIAVIGSSGLWQFLQHKSGADKKFMNRMDEIQESIRNLEQKEQSDVADRLRTQILTFNAELLKGFKHTQEQYVEIIRIVDKYEAYCDTHPNYSNSRAVISIEHIRENYKERQEDGDYLKGCDSP